MNSNALTLNKTFIVLSFDKNAYIFELNYNILGLIANVLINFPVYVLRTKLMFIHTKRKQMRQWRLSEMSSWHIAFPKWR